jgi:hypothetical protein
MVAHKRLSVHPAASTREGGGPDRTGGKTIKKKMQINGVCHKISDTVRKVRINEQCLINSID